MRQETLKDAGLCFVFRDDLVARVSISLHAIHHFGYNISCQDSCFFEKFEECRILADGLNMGNSVRRDNFPQGVDELQSRGVLVCISEQRQNVTDSAFVKIEACQVMLQLLKREILEDLDIVLVAEYVKLCMTQEDRGVILAMVSVPKTCPARDRALREILRQCRADWP